MPTKTTTDTNSTTVSNNKITTEDENSTTSDSNSTDSTSTGTTTKTVAKTIEIPITNYEDALDFGKIAMSKESRGNGHTIELKTFGSLEWLPGNWCKVILPTYDEEGYMYVTKTSSSSSADDTWNTGITLADYPPTLGSGESNTPSDTSTDASTSGDTTTNSDGSTTTINSDGSSTTTYSDGSTSTTTSSGKTTTTGGSNSKAAQANKNKTSNYSKGRYLSTKSGRHIKLTNNTNLKSNYTIKGLTFTSTGSYAHTNTVHSQASTKAPKTSGLKKLGTDIGNMINKVRSWF